VDEVGDVGGRHRGLGVDGEPLLPTHERREVVTVARPEEGARPDDERSRPAPSTSFSALAFERPYTFSGAGGSDST
jgi:hypothetical protein